MGFIIYKLAEAGDSCKRWYLTDLPEDDNPIGGVGYRGDAPELAGIAPTEADAIKICEYLRTAFYGDPQEHLYEAAP